MSSNASLYDQVVRVTNVYLGPAADRFISRQVQNHLHKPAAELTANDLLQLIDWIRIGVSMMTEDSGIVDEYAEQLLKLAQAAGQRKARHG